MIIVMYIPVGVYLAIFVGVCSISALFAIRQILDKNKNVSVQNKKSLTEEQLNAMSFSEQANVGRDKTYDDETRIMAIKMRWDVPMLNEVMNDKSNSQEVRDWAKKSLGMAQMMGQALFGRR